MIEIRPVARSEAALLRSFLYHAVHVRPGDEPPPAECVDEPMLASYYQDWGRDGDCCFVADLGDNQIIGAAWVRQFTEANPGYGFINESVLSLAISVLPEFRGKGIGTQLLEVLFQECYPTSISLSVQKTNPAANLYRRFGFEEVRETNEEWVMQLR